MPANVKVSVADSTIQVEGPKGKLSFNYRSEIDVKVDEAGRQVLVSRATTNGRAAPCTA
jgi:large subunit ribosomal protein L6